MSVEIRPEPFPDKPKDLSTLIGMADQYRENLVNSAQKYANLPINKNENEFASATQLSFEAVAEATKALIASDATEKEKRLLVLNFLADDSQRRMEKFNKIAGSPIVEAFPLDELQEARGVLQDEDYEEPGKEVCEKWLENTINSYGEIFVEEANAFLIHISGSVRAKLLERSRKIGIEAIKMTGAAVLGIYLNKQIEKHQAK